MKPLSEMSLEELAREWHDTIKAGGVICDVAIELERRQRLLDAADELYRQLRLDSHARVHYSEALSAYESAKEKR